MVGGVAEKEREGAAGLLARRLVVFSLPLLAVLVVLLVYYLAPSTSPVDGSQGSSGGVKRALIIDGLYEAYPNDTLVSVLRGLLEEHGYVVDVYRGREVGVDVFSRLVEYDLVVMRLHGGYASGAQGFVGGIFTGVPWSSRYLDWAKRGLVAEGVPVYPPPRGPKVFLALLPKFFDEVMEGRFRDGSVIIAGGCYTALDEDLVRVFCSKGLSVYIGFRGKVLLSDLDRVLPLIVEAVVTGDSSGFEDLAETVTGLVVFECNG